MAGYAKLALLLLACIGSAGVGGYVGHSLATAQMEQLMLLDAVTGVKLHTRMLRLLDGKQVEKARDAERALLEQSLVVLKTVDGGLDAIEAKDLAAAKAALNDSASLSP
jgi:hypothetical protein